MSFKKLAAFLFLCLLVSSFRLLAWADQSGDLDLMDAQNPAVWTVSQDGSGDFSSIQEAIDQARSGDTIRIKAGRYAEDVTVHSKERLLLIGEGMDQVILSGKRRVGTLHIGKWPYGATKVEVSGLTVHQHGGLGVGIFNGQEIVLKNLRVNGQVFGQQVHDVHLEHCDIGGSETTGVSFADSRATLVGNFIHDNDHGIVIGGKSQVHIQENVITRSLFEAVLVSDQSNTTLVQNTLVGNGSGVRFQRETAGQVRGNIIVNNKLGFVFAPESQTRLSYNALHNNGADYLFAGLPSTAALERRGQTDVHLAPMFVGPEQDDFRLQTDTPLLGIGGYAFLGALPPIDAAP